MGAIAIIPARGGSRRIPLKNVREFHGQPIIAYSIQAAFHSGVFDSVIVSTDDTHIASVAEEYGAKVHRRSAYFARDEVGTQEVMGQVLDDLGRVQLLPDYACCIYPCAPMIHPGMLVRAILSLGDQYAQYVVPVGKWLEDPGLFYAGKTAAFLSRHPLISYQTRIMEVDEHRCCDINTPADWMQAEEQYRLLKGMEKK